MLLPKRLHKMALGLAIVLILLSIIIYTNIGVADITPLETFKIILSKIPFLGTTFDNFENSKVVIITKIRLPRIILALICGCGLSIVGGTFQSMFKNPMADPYVIGISSGATLGATLAIVFSLFVSLFAFIFSLITTVIVYLISRVGGKVVNTTLLLSGVTINSFISAFITLLMIFNEDEISKITFWVMGSFTTASWNKVMIVLPVVIIGSIIIYIYSNDLNIILTGEDEARTLGVDVDRVKAILLIASALIIAVCVSFTGSIGFVGLIVPHVVRIIFGPDNKKLLPFSALFGGLFLISCDTFARTILNPIEIPVGAITALIGAPFFLYLLIREKRNLA